MTREEAIEWIKTDISRLIMISRLPNTPAQNAHKEALNMAIKALEQELIFEEIKAEALSLKINYTDFDRDAYRRGINDVLKIIDKYKADKEGD